MSELPVFHTEIPEILCLRNSKFRELNSLFAVRLACELNAYLKLSDRHRRDM